MLIHVPDNTPYIQKIARWAAEINCTAIPLDIQYLGEDVVHFVERQNIDPDILTALEEIARDG